MTSRGELLLRIEEFFRHAAWMTQDEIAAQARLLLREAADCLAQSETDSDHASARHATLARPVRADSDSESASDSLT
jgi:hypothetical protein